MNETFEIKFFDDKHYKILQQPEIEFPQCKMCDIIIASVCFPETSPSTICLRGSIRERDEIRVSLYPNHFRALEKLCNIKHWRFVACI